MNPEIIESIPPRGENGPLQAFVECPKGSVHKIGLDKDLGIFRWSLGSQTFGAMRDIGDLRDGLLWEPGEFFRIYNRMTDRRIEIHEPEDGPEDRGAAEKMVERAIAAKR